MVAYYMTSGGAITATPPAATTGDIDQAVGIAVSSTELELLVSGPVTKA